VFSMGLILLNAWTLQDVRGFNATTHEAEVKRDNAIRSLEQHLPIGFADLLMKMLCESEEDRFDFVEIEDKIPIIEKGENINKPLILDSLVVQQNNQKNVSNLNGGIDLKDIPKFLKPDLVVNKPNQNISAPIKLTIKLEEYGYNFVVELKETTTLKEIQDFLLIQQDGLEAIPGSRFHFMLGGDKVYLDEPKTIKDIGLKNNDILDIFLSFESVFYVNFISLKDPKKNKTMKFDTDIYNYYSFKELAENVDKTITNYKFFILGEHSSDGGTQSFPDETQLITPIVDKVQEQMTFTLVEYSSIEPGKVKLSIELPEFQKKLDLELTDDVLIMDILETVSDHFTLEKKGAYLSYNGSTLMEYMDCRSLNMKNGATLILSRK